MSLQGSIVEITERKQPHKETLYSLINSFYDDLTPEAFYQVIHCWLSLFTLHYFVWNENVWDIIILAFIGRELVLKEESHEVA